MGVTDNLCLTQASFISRHYTFIKSFAARASPLTELLKKSESFHWGSEQDISFKYLKYALTHAPVLTFPNFKDPFLIYTDASTVGIEAVLMQTDGAGKNHVIQ